MSRSTSAAIDYAMMNEDPAVIQAAFAHDYRLESVAFMHSVIALVAKLVTVDGAATKAEYDVFHALFVENAAIDTAQARSWFVQRGTDSSSAIQYARQIVGMTVGEIALHTDLMQRLVQVAAADAPLNAAEIELLREIAEVFGFVKDAFRGLISPQAASANASPYALLGVTARASDKEVREHYMARVQALHPDRYHAVGASEETIALLSDQLATLNAAYNSVQQVRAKKSSRTMGLSSWFGRKNTKGTSD